MRKLQGRNGHGAGFTGRAHRLLSLAGLLALVLAAAGCALPFEFSREGWTGNASAVDPSTPDLTAMPKVTYTQAVGSGGTVANGGNAVTASDTAISLATDTPGAVIYFTTDGSNPDPRSAATAQFTPGTTIPLSISSPTSTNSSKSISVKALAIGPNMKPSLVTSAVLTLQYPQASSPVFSVPAGTYNVDKDVVVQGDPGSTIWYTIDGSAPGEGIGTSLQIAPGSSIHVTGRDATGVVTLRAVAVEPQVLSSASVAATYTFQAAQPTASPGIGTYFGSVTIASLSASAPVDSIHYETGGGAVGQGSPTSLPFTMSASFTLSIKAFKANYKDSVQVNLHYTVATTDYSSMTPAIIASEDSAMTATSIDNSDANPMVVGDLILYRTNAGNYGALVVTALNPAGSNNGIQFNYTTYAGDGSVLAAGTNALCKGTFLFDLDGPGETPPGPTTGQEDFKADNQTATVRSFSPVNGARFVLVGVDPTP